MNTDHMASQFASEVRCMKQCIVQPLMEKEETVARCLIAKTMATIDSNPKNGTSENIIIITKPWDVKRVQNVAQIEVKAFYNGFLGDVAGEAKMGIEAPTEAYFSVPVLPN
ncbi:hypothetical protein HKD37_01G002093 [Glycine soja]